MVTLRFILSPEAAARVHDILTCLSRFSETVSIEARRDALSFTALNSSKTTYASFALEADRFFSEYECTANNGDSDVRFTCRILGKALLSVFKGRIVDPRARDSAIDRCEVTVNDSPDGTECRFVVKMFCNQGVVKTYRLMYESADVMHALFDKNSANSRWAIHSSMLKEFVEYFGTKTEQLDIYAEDERVVFTSFTEKITNGKEVLKHPMRTAVSANKGDFDSFNAQDKIHTIISVRDFKSIVSHADTLRTSVSACYSQPSRPLQFSYGADGIHCEFTMMTSGDNRGVPPPANNAAPMTTRSISRAQSRSASRGDMPPPQAPPSRNSARRARPPGSAKAPVVTASTTVAAQNQEPEPVSDLDPESLFIAEQDDARWDPADYDQDETLGWDASASNEPEFQATFRDSGSLARTPRSESLQEGLAPTQRLSQVQGLW